MPRTREPNDPIPSQDEVLGWFESLRNWDRFGARDRLRTLNYIGSDERLHALRIPATGRAISCAWDISPTDPLHESPPKRSMLWSGVQHCDPDQSCPIPAIDDGHAGYAIERISLVYHGLSVTHLDSLAHAFWEGVMYGGVSAEQVDGSRGAAEHDVRSAADGVLGRGVLLDAAAGRRVPWLDAGEAIRPTELEALERHANLEVGRGDIVMLRTGTSRRRREDPGWNPTAGRPGWHAECLPWFAEREVAVVAADVAQDAVPSGYERILQPIHSIGIVAMGLWLLDNCDLEELAEACHEAGRYEFMLTLIPLRLQGVTGSPANPIALL